MPALRGEADFNERLKIAPSKTLAKVRFGDLVTFYQRLKTPKEGHSNFCYIVRI